MAVKMNEKSALSWNFLGLCWNSLGDCNEGLPLSPPPLSPFLSLIFSLTAIPCYQKCVEIDPELKEVICNFLSLFLHPELLFIYLFIYFISSGVVKYGKSLSRFN